MQKFLLIPVMFVYLVVTSGVMVNFHYCMNKLSSTELFASGGKQCDKCGMHKERSHGCCHDDVKIVKMDDDHRFAAEMDLNILSIQPVVGLPSAYTDAPFVNLTGLVAHRPEAPPNWSEQGLFAEIGVFRI